MIYVRNIFEYSNIKGTDLKVLLIKVKESSKNTLTAREPMYARLQKKQALVPQLHILLSQKIRISVLTLPSGLPML